MKAVLPILTASVIVILLACAGCEPEPQTQPSTEVIQQEVVEIPESIEQAEPDEMTEQAEEAEEAVEDIAEAVHAETGTEPEQAEEQQAASDEDNVIVKVNGAEITAAQLEVFMRPQIERLNQQYGDKEHDDRYKDIEKRIRDRALDAVVTMTLIQQQMDAGKIIVTDEQIDRYIEDMAASENMTVENLKMLVTSRGGNFEEWKNQMQFDKRIGVVELIEAQNFGSLDVNEAETQAYYEENDRLFRKPEQVEASHILIKVDTSDPNIESTQAESMARTKAEGLLQQIKTGADFAELAMKYSDCPSSVNGGKLGFGTRRTWVPEFAQTAFALQPGEVGDVVKTRFGYHIIKVTDRKDASVTSFEDAKDEITKRLKGQKERKVGEDYISFLRKNAKIEYSPQYEEFNPMKVQ
ncbi:MAG: peptidylprolyl isomerase [Sedimentisphaerales bacterium]|nr:peptidylprolyl isomerase [Sedimentisphaerales bacterium]